MENQKNDEVNELHTLMPLEQFKSILGIDDREDKLARFCLVTATCTIEQYCMRRLLIGSYVEDIDFLDDSELPLREYPVYELLAVFFNKNEKFGIKSSQIITPEFFRVTPNPGSLMDIPFSIKLSPSLERYRGLKAVKVIYFAGYLADKVPPDLAAACMELAMWNMNRYRGRRIGITGGFKGNGKESDQFEMSIPENVRTLLEPYRRKTI
jgi:hypothetical protein